MTKGSPPEQTDPADECSPREGEEIIRETSEDSFPASDPPSFSAPAVAGPTS